MYTGWCIGRRTPTVGAHFLKMVLYGEMLAILMSNTIQLSYVRCQWMALIGKCMGSEIDVLLLDQEHARPWCQEVCSAVDHVSLHI
jgi:hypothetical protein